MFLVRFTKGGGGGGGDDGLMKFPAIQYIGKVTAAMTPHAI